jgi:hypothetical protein
MEAIQDSIRNPKFNTELAPNRDSIGWATEASSSLSNHFLRLFSQASI